MKELYYALLKFVERVIFLIFTTIIKVIISYCLLNKIIYRIKVCIKANKIVLVITEAVKVVKKIIYKMRLNLDI